MKLVVSDAHEGLKAAVTKVLHATWQRCRVHFARNALAHAGKAQRRIVSAWIDTAYAQEDAAAAHAQWRTVADQLRPKVPKLATLMDAVEENVLAYPPRHYLAYGTRRFTTCTASGAVARSTVEALTFRAVTRTLLLLHTWQSSTKAMLLASSEASAKSPRRAPATVTSMFSVAPAVRLGRSQVVSSAGLRVPTGTAGQAWSTAGAASGRPNSRSASTSIGPSKPIILLDSH